MKAPDRVLLERISRKWQTAELGISSAEVGDVMRELPAVIEALYALDHAPEDRELGQLVRERRLVGWEVQFVRDSVVDPLTPSEEGDGTAQA